MFIILLMSNYKKPTYESLALHLYETPPEIKRAPWWGLHRAIDFYSVSFSRNAEVEGLRMAQGLTRLLGSLCTLDAYRESSPPEAPAPASSGTS
jgi:hypothetical protein